MLGARLRFHRKQHGAFPGTIDELRAKHVPKETFITPGADKPYIYLGPKGKGSLLLHGHPNGKDGRICVLTKRLKLKRITAAELKQQLQRASGGR